MQRISTTFSAVVCTTILFLPSVIWSATLQMKSGQKVEGEYLDGSSTEVRIKVGSHTLKFKISEIAAIIFDESSVSQDEFTKAAKDVLRSLKGLAAVAEAGVTYNDYSPRVSNAKIKVNEFLEEYKDAPMPEFSQHVIDAIDYYVAASTAWNAKITKSASIPILDPFRKCKALADALKDKLRNFPGDEHDPVFESIYYSNHSMPYLWYCAKDKISQAESLLKK